MYMIKYHSPSRLSIHGSRGAIARLTKHIMESGWSVLCRVFQWFDR